MVISRSHIRRAERLRSNLHYFWASPVRLWLLRDHINRVLTRGVGGRASHWSLHAINETYRKMIVARRIRISRTELYRLSPGMKTALLVEFLFSR